MERSDILLVGAAGVEGQLIAKHLANSEKGHHAGRHRELRVTLCGRHDKELYDLREQLGKKDVWHVVASECETQETVDELVQNARVVCNTLPNARIGLRFVSACMRMERDYCDMLFEPAWLHTLADQYHETARSNGVFLVPACGLTSMLPDLGFSLAEQALKETEQAEPTSLVMLTTRFPYAAGSASYLEAMRHLFESRQMMMMMRDSYFFNPKTDRPTPNSVSYAELDQLGVAYEPDLRMWSYPSGVRSFIDMRVARRSASLRGLHYIIAEADGSSSLLYATLGWLSRILFLLFVVFSLTRMLVFKLIPSSKPFFLESRGSSHMTRTSPDRPTFEAHIIAKGQSQTHGKIKLFAAVWSTLPLDELAAACVANAALCLARDKDQAKISLERDGGVLTPSTAFGPILINRLKHAGVAHFLVDKDKPLL